MKKKKQIPIQFYKEKAQNQIKEIVEEAGVQKIARKANSLFENELGEKVVDPATVSKVANGKRGVSYNKLNVILSAAQNIKPELKNRCKEAQSFYRKGEGEDLVE